VALEPNTLAIPGANQFPINKTDASRTAVPLLQHKTSMNNTVPLLQHKAKQEQHCTIVAA